MTADSGVGNLALALAAATPVARPPDSAVPHNSPSARPRLNPDDRPAARGLKAIDRR